VEARLATCRLAEPDADLLWIDARPFKRRGKVGGEAATHLRWRPLSDVLFEATLERSEGSEKK
jgi:hypothetical protein